MTAETRKPDLSTVAETAKVDFVSVWRSGRQPSQGSGFQFRRQLKVLKRLPERFKGLCFVRLIRRTIRFSTIQQIRRSILVSIFVYRFFTVCQNGRLRSLVKTGRIILTGLAKARLSNRQPSTLN